ncbi:MAG TPA: hypothetical protein VHQ24_15000 [Lachnospiraceae bacterium]|nr:hypothetical protein [Lachnospiraceae bacterium]HEX3078167.1 hypothetical protein [Lachnospiraceae bacterium]
MEKVKFIFRDGTVIEDSLSDYILPYNEITKHIYEYLKRYERGIAISTVDDLSKEERNDSKRSNIMYNSGEKIRR